MQLVVASLSNYGAQGNPFVHAIIANEGLPLRGQLVEGLKYQRRDGVWCWWYGTHGGRGMVPK